jgi:hypothetical protein
MVHQRPLTRRTVRFAAKSIEVELSFEWVAKWIPFVDLGVKGGGSGKAIPQRALSAVGCPADRLSDEMSQLHGSNVA